jgi:adenylosuccinate synthase
VGYAYGDKALRWGVRVADLIDDATWKERISENLERHRLRLESEGDLAQMKREAIDRLTPARDTLRALAVDGPAWLWERLSAGKRVLAEGAQGVMLDIDHGTYPFLTSSNTTTGAVCTGLGIGPSSIGQIWGVTKAYATRVGEGPFPTELHGALGEQLRTSGGEFGATTGRPRRCGWLDLVAVQRAVALCGVTRLVVTKLDVLDSIDEIQICTAYEDANGNPAAFPQTSAEFARVAPKCETHRGWQKPTRGAMSWEDLPSDAHAYLERIEALTGLPVAAVSTGSDRQHTIFRD